MYPHARTVVFHSIFRLAVFSTKLLYAVAYVPVFGAHSCARRFFVALHRKQSRWMRAPANVATVRPARSRTVCQRSTYLHQCGQRPPFSRTRKVYHTIPPNSKSDFLGVFVECGSVEMLPMANTQCPIGNVPHSHFLSSTLNGTSLWWFTTFSFPAHFNIGMSGVPFVGVPEAFRPANKGSASIAAAIAATATRKRVMPIFRLISPHMSSPSSQSCRITRSCAFQN